MALQFPNRSRSFDRTRNAIRFIGHDGMFEVPFFVDVDALTKPGTTGLSEVDFLNAFDAALSSIHNIARETYFNRRGGLHLLTASDFR